jgi:hypothetical protein
LVDAELPDGDGITLARELAALPWRPRIVLTSIDRDIATAERPARLFGGVPQQGRTERFTPGMIADGTLTDYIV